MGWKSLEHGSFAYRADFALYGSAVVLLASFLWVGVPTGQRAAALAGVGIGLTGWSVVEYALHRFVLHGLQPFSRWHALHHQRPKALVCTPTLLSASLIALLVFLPMCLLASLWLGSALTLGLLAGYFAYAVVHHATHHGPAWGGWLKQRRRWHALHHGHGAAGHFGVTSGFWDHVCGTAGLGARPAGRPTASDPTASRPTDTRQPQP